MPVLNLAELAVYWEEYGDPKGRPLFFFHGWPGSHLQAEMADEIGRRLGLWLIAPDRPGMGRSSFQPVRKILDWPMTVSLIADQLKLNSFSVFGISGGGPYALACARQIPQRLTGVGVCSGVPYAEWLQEDPSASSLLRTAVRLHDHLPRLAPPVFRLLRNYMLHLGSPDSLRTMLPLLPAPDRTFLASSPLLDSLWYSTREAYQQSAEGVLHDIRLLTADWGFKPWEIPHPIRWWHGNADTICPVSGVELVCRRAEKIDLTIFPNEGHYSLPLGRTEEILQHFVR